MAASLNGQSPQTGAPASIAPWSTWAFWQYGQGTVSGIEGACDEDVFNGTLASFTSTYVVVSSAPSIASLTTNQTVWQGSNAIFSVTAPNSVSYQWVFNNKNIANATGSSLTLANCQISNAGPYYVVANGAHASSTSSVVFLSVLPVLTNAPNAALIPSNMMDWWPANANANDIYGTNNGTPAGGFTYTNGHTGLAFRFDGSSASVTTGAGDVAPPWTACMWVNYSHTSQASAGLLEDGVYGLKLEQKGSGTHNVGISQSNYLDSSFNYAAPTNTWTHLAFVATTSNVTLYANGVNEGSISTNTMPLPRAYIGAGHSSVSGNYIDFMLGSLDDVMIYGRALSSNEVNGIYNAGSASLVCAPHIIGGQATTNGHFNLNVQGVTGKNFNILVSTNLTTWQSVGALTNPNGTNTYVVPNIHKYNQIYFSISQPY